MSSFMRNCLQIMQYVFTLLLLSSSAAAQTTYLPFGSKAYQTLDRLEIKTRDENLSFSTVKPYMRKASVESVERIDSILQTDPNYANITEIDKYNMLHFLMDNSEWSKARDYYKNDKPVLNALYKTKPNLLEVNNNDLFLAVNPVIYFSASKEKNNSQFLYQNTRGLSVRGLISKRVGFDLYFTENQERDPTYVTNWIIAHTAVPGVGNYKNKRGARTIAIDAGSKSLFLPTAEFEPPAAQGGRPKMIAGTFQVLVIKY